MFIRFNYRCPSCRNEEERFIKKTMMDFQACDECTTTTLNGDVVRTTMTRLPAAPRTTFRFHDKKLKR